MTKQNCWEFKKCGREPGGGNILKEGVCPAATFELADGFCGGKNGGRACAYIIGTLCSADVCKIDDVAEKQLGPARYPCPIVRIIEIHAWTKKKWGIFPISQGWEFNQYGPSERRTAR